MTSSAASDLIVSARLANGTVDKMGAGTLELAAGATGTGTAVNWTIKEGTILASTASVVGGAVTVNGSSAVLDIAGNNQTTVGTVTLKSGSISGSTGILTASSYAVESGSISAILAGTGGLTKSTTGTVTLSGANTYTGATAIKNGTLALGVGNDRLPTGTTVTLGDAATNDSGIFKLDSRSQQLAGLLIAGSGTGNRVVNGNATAATLTLNIASGTQFLRRHLGGTGTNENNFAITKTGTGTLTLSGAANTFTGGVTVEGGTLLLNKAIDVDSIAANNAVLVKTGGIIKLGTNRGQIADGITSFTLDGGTFDLAEHVEGINPAVTMNNGNITGTSAGFILARGGYIGTGTNTISQRISVRGEDANSGKFDITSGTTTVSGAIYTDWGAASGITKTGAGTLVLSGTNSYTLATQVTAGTLQLGNGGTTRIAFHQQRDHQQREPHDQPFESGGAGNRFQRRSHHGDGFPDASRRGNHHAERGEHLLRRHYHHRRHTGACQQQRGGRDDGSHQTPRRDRIPSEDQFRHHRCQRHCFFEHKYLIQRDPQGGCLWNLQRRQHPRKKPDERSGRHEYHRQDPRWDEQ